MLEIDRKAFFIHESNDTFYVIEKSKRYVVIKN